MPRKTRPVPGCVKCGNAITLFFALRFETCDGWCSEKCFDAWCDSEDRRLADVNDRGKKKIQVIGHPTPSAQR